MSKNPNERQRMPGRSENPDRDIQEQKHDKKQKSPDETNKEQQQHHRQGEPMGQKTEQTQKRKQTVQFDKGQKFTSDEDLKRRSA